MVSAYLEKPELRREDATTGNAGVAFKVDCWTRLDRFLILGAESNTIYAEQKDILKSNVSALEECLSQDSARTIARIVEISDSGRAPKNEPAIFALAKAASHPDTSVRQIALGFSNLERVCRTLTHLYHFLAYVQAQPVVQPRGANWRGHDGKPLTDAQMRKPTRNMSRLLRKAVQRWVFAKGVEGIAFQGVKYQQRDGYSLKDVWRMAHVNPGGDMAMRAVDHWVRYGIDDEYLGYAEVPDIIRAFEQAKRAQSSSEIMQLIQAHGLPREAIPTQFLGDPVVWEALLFQGNGMPITALIRNLAKMTSIGMVAPGSNAERVIYDRLTDVDVLRKGRVHPISLLSALKVYEQGHGERGKLKWTPSKKVTNALDESFYLAFQTIQPTNKRLLLAVDVSWSMQGARVVGLPHIDARMAAGAMSLVTAATEPNAEILAFSHTLVPLTIRPSMRLDEVLRQIDKIPMGGTFVRLPIEHALKSRKPVDAFVTYTDSETSDGYGAGNFGLGWSNVTFSTGSVNDALQKYRQQSGIPARSVVLAFSANEISVAHPDDPLQLDMVGLDAAGPALLADFIRGDL